MSRSDWPDKLDSSVLRSMAAKKAKGKGRSMNAMNTETKDRAAIGPLRIFVYGTLKRGYWNHDRFCRGAYYIEEATVCGRLYALPSGIPVLQVPDSDILAMGTSNLLADVRIQESFIEKLPLDADRKGDWQIIRGEMIVFPDARLSLPPIDRLEGFRPDAQSLYLRVLVPVVTDGDEQVTAWCYMAGETIIHSIAPTGKTSWP